MNPSTRNGASNNQPTPMLYTITFSGNGGYDKPTFKVVAKSAEIAIETARRDGLKENEKDYSVRWITTDSHVDLISFDGYKQSGGDVHASD